MRDTARDIPEIARGNFKGFFADAKPYFSQDHLAGLFVDMVVGRKGAACFQEKFSHKGFITVDDSFHPDAGKDFFIADFVTFLKHKSLPGRFFGLFYIYIYPASEFKVAEPIQGPGNSGADLIRNKVQKIRFISFL